MFDTLCGLLIRVLPSYQPILSVCIVSWAQTFEDVMYESRTYRPALAFWIFHQVAPSLVLMIVGIKCQVHRAFEVFDDPDRDLAQS
jgi:hypothetical protein